MTDQSNFGEWLHTYEVGEFADRCDRHLTDLLRAVVGLQKKGTLTIKGRGRAVRHQGRHHRDSFRRGWTLEVA